MKRATVMRRLRFAYMTPAAKVRVHRRMRGIADDLTEPGRPRNRDWVRAVQREWAR